MAHINWKLAFGLFIGLVVVIAVVAQVTRSVGPYEPPEGRQLRDWGSGDLELAQKFQSVLDNDVNLIKVPGLQAFIRIPDSKTWSGTTGTTDLARKDLLQRDHVIRVGSVTKTFTAVLILKLVEAGNLNLDETVEKWFPQLPSADSITIRQLLNHSSGIPEIIPKVLMKSIIPTTSWHSDELVALIVEDEPQFTPGSEFGYSNSNYILLGLIAEDVSGKPVAQLLHEQILDPLNLKHTYFIPYESAPTRLLAGFDRDLASIPGMLKINPSNTSWATSAYTSGAIASTAEDFGIFFDALFTGTLLSSSTMEDTITFIGASNPGFPEQTGSGLGVMRLEIDGQELMGHLGQFMGSTAVAMYSPTGNYTIAVTSNLSNADLVRVLNHLQEVIREQP